MEDNSFEGGILELQESLSRYAYNLTSNRDDAKDLVQETLYKALKYKDKFNQETNLKAWVFTIMKNTFINDYRRKVKRGSIFSEDVHEFVISNKPAEYGPEADLGYRELTKVVNSLDPEFKIPFNMHVQGYKYQEIADELGLHLGTVKSRIHFSRQKLIEKLK